MDILFNIGPAGTPEWSSSSITLARGEGSSVTFAALQTLARDLRIRLSTFTPTRDCLFREELEARIVAFLEARGFTSQSSSTKPRITVDNDFELIDTSKHGYVLDACPICSSEVEVWEQKTGIMAGTKAVCCTNAGPIGPVNSTCPLYLPDASYYRSTIREAVNDYVGYSEALVNLRERGSK